MKRILVLGGNGMLGHKMFQKLRDDFPETWCTINNALTQPLYKHVSLFQGGHVLDGVDVIQNDRLVEILFEMQPEVVINCIGLIKQRDEAQSAIPCITLNSLLPHKLSKICKELGSRLIHFSTDCVFDGRKGNYTETDKSTAEDLYGKSKHLGEVTEAPALTLRTSIIGRELTNFKSLLEWFLSQRGKTVHGYTNVIYSGVTTNYLAQLVSQLIVQHPLLTGLYQVASQPISKYELLCQLRDAYRLEVEIEPSEREHSDRSMSAERFIKATNYYIPTWPELIEQLVYDKTPYEQWHNI